MLKLVIFPHLFELDTGLAVGLELRAQKRLLLTLDGLELQQLGLAGILQLPRRRLVVKPLGPDLVDRRGRPRRLVIVHRLERVTEMYEGDQLTNKESCSGKHLTNSGFSRGSEICHELQRF